MSGKMKESQSSDNVCTVPSSMLKSDKEKVFTLELIVPLFFLGAYFALIKTFYDQFEKEKDTDPFQRVWIAGPIFFTVLYLSVVYFGQKFMKNREEFKIKPYIFAYNLYQCLLNIYTVYAMVLEVYTNPIFNAPWGNVNVPGVASYRIGFLIWLHYNNKYVELLDTLWMVLRKKNNQISFLHCYHHVLLIWAWWFCCSVETGGDCYFGATVNSFIHIIMYGYYTLTLLNIPCPWKKWITNCQMLQFAVCFTHSCFVIYTGNSPIVLPLAQGFVMVNMLYLFGRFYIASYGTKKATKKVE